MNLRNRLRRSTRIATTNSKKDLAPVRKTRVTTKVTRPTKTKNKTKTKKDATKTTTTTTTTVTTTTIVDTPQIKGLVDPLSNIRDGEVLYLHDDDEGGSEPCDVMLVNVDPKKNMDRFYVIQLIERNDDRKRNGSEYYTLFTRWGRTGNDGVSQVEDYTNYDDAVKAFEGKFRSKTGIEWEHRHTSPTQNGKYRYVKQDHVEKSHGYTGAKWMYYVDDGVDGKRNGWYDYTKEGSVQTEQLFLEHGVNANFHYRVVESGLFSYGVDLVNMTQTNVSHPNRTTRRIKRVVI